MSEALKPAQLKNLHRLLSTYGQNSASEAVKANVLEILADIQANLQVKRARSGADLLHQQEQDENEHAFRSVGRRIAAGTLYCLNGHPDKQTWLEDFTTLFEGPWNPNDLPFPAKDGRQFLADLLSDMLDDKITFQQIVEWFYVPDNQSLCVSSDLLQRLRIKGISQWPPHADKLPQCATYKLQTRKRSHSEAEATDQQTAQLSTSASTLGSGAGLLPYNPTAHTLSDEARAGPSDYLEAGLLESLPVAGPLDYAPTADPQALPHTGAGPLPHSPMPHLLSSYPGAGLYGHEADNMPFCHMDSPEDVHMTHMTHEATFHQHPATYSNSAFFAASHMACHSFPCYSDGGCHMPNRDNLGNSAWLHATEASTPCLPLPSAATVLEANCYQSVLDMITPDQLAPELAASHSSSGSYLANDDVLLSDASGTFDDVDGCGAVEDVNALELLL